MEVLELRDKCIESGKTYLKWLEENDKGLQEVDIYSIYTEDEEHFKLKLSSKLFNTEAIILRWVRNGNDYTDLFKVVEYDSDKRVLILKRQRDLPFEFNNDKKAEFKIISSLRFLVQNLIDWYTLNGKDLELPSAKSILYDNLSELEYLNGTSNEQRSSIKMMFENPFSYVWGAPGTGKTRWVLTQAMLFYIKHNKRVAIVAPTNNAIEQVLIAILPIAIERGVKKTKFLRLGNPSKAFAETYPEVCEVRGVEKQLSRIDKQLDLLRRIRFVKRDKARLEEVINSPVLEMMTSTKTNMEKTNLQISECKSKMGSLNSELKKLSSAVTKNNIELADIINKKDSLVSKFFNVLRGNKVDYEEKYSLLTKISQDLTLQKEEHENEIRRLRDRDSELIETKDKQKLELSNLIKEGEPLYKWLWKSDEEFKLTKNNIESFKKELSDKIERKKTQLAGDILVAKEYELLPDSQIQTVIEELKKKRDFISSQTTQERLKSVNVVACTLDTYIGRFSEENLEVEHFFVDEAGYANAIKALPLFTQNRPITLLGDHMQLPPVCELNRYKILNEKEYESVFLWHYTSTCIGSLFLDEYSLNYLHFLQYEYYSQEGLKMEQLKVTYRFGSNLANVLGRFVYKIDFTSGTQEGRTDIISIHAEKTTNELKSRQSLNEVLAIKSLIPDLLLKKEKFAILSPYRKGQLKLLGNHLPEQRNNEQILTVHGSQGKEWDTVLLSVVDTSDMFFTDTSKPNSTGIHLINTAVSRAKKRLIIVCDTNYWLGQPNQLISELLRIGDQIHV